MAKSTIHVLHKPYIGYACESGHDLEKGLPDLVTTLGGH